MPEAAMQVPDTITEDPVASFLSPTDRQEEINTQIAAEGGFVNDTSTVDVTSGYDREQMSYGASLSLVGQGKTIFESVMNNEMSSNELDNLSEQQFSSLAEQARNYVTTLGVLGAMSGKDMNDPVEVVSVFEQIRTGELDLSSASPSAQRNISLMAGNLPALPMFMAQSARDWAMDTRRDPAAGGFQTQIAENFAARQAATGKFDLSAKVVQNGAQGIQTGPEEPKFEPELEGKINSGPPQNFMM